MELEKKLSRLIAALITDIFGPFVVVLAFFLGGWILSLAFSDLLNPFTRLFLGADIVQFMTIAGLIAYLLSRGLEIFKGR